MGRKHIYIYIFVVVVVVFIGNCNCVFFILHTNVILDTRINRNCLPLDQLGYDMHMAMIRIHARHYTSVCTVSVIRGIGGGGERRGESSCKGT